MSNIDSDNDIDVDVDIDIDIDSDLLNDEKDIHDEKLRKPRVLKIRRSMDAELHVTLDDYIDGGDCDRNSDEYGYGGCGKFGHDRHGKDEIVKSTESTRPYDSDSDEDTFADADSDCEPNQYYLDEMLEDIHPEHLNLFDYRKKEQGWRDASHSSILSISESQYDENDDDDDGDSSVSKDLEGSSTSRLDDNDDNGGGGGSDRCRFGIKGNLDLDASEHDRVDEDDTFGSLPATTREKRKGWQMGLNNFGSSTGAAAGPGRPLLRQPSRKEVWGK